jgi:hypothetical protein
MPAKKTIVPKTSAMIDPRERVEAPEPVSRAPLGWTTTVVWLAERSFVSMAALVVVEGGAESDVEDEGGSVEDDDEEDAALELAADEEAGVSLEVVLLPSWEGSLTTMEDARPLSSP